MKTIVKVQLPLTGLADLALVYQKDREHQRFIDITPQLREKMKGSLKAFFEADFLNGAYQLGDLIDDQPW